MTSKEFAQSLGFTQEGVENNNEYVIIFKDSNEYSKAYSILDKSNNIDLDLEGNIFSEHTNLMKYLADDFDILLEANFDDDEYKITFKEI